MIPPLLSVVPGPYIQMFLLTTLPEIFGKIDIGGAYAPPISIFPILLVLEVAGFFSATSRTKIVAKHSEAYPMDNPRTSSANRRRAESLQVSLLAI